MGTMSGVPLRGSLLSILFFLKLLLLALVTIPLILLLMIVVKRLELDFSDSLVMNVLYSPVFYLQFLYFLFQLIDLLLLFLILLD